MDWPLLAGADADDVAALLAVARRRSFKRGEVVFHVGDPADALHLVRKGRFAVRMSTPRGEQAILAVVGPGESFGELALFPMGSRRSATVEAVEAGETLCVAASDFARLRRDNTGMWELLCVLLANQVRRLSTRALVAHYLDSDARVRWALAELAETYQPAGGAATITLTQDAIAELAGTSRATANRVLREEQERGSIVVERGRVIVSDRDALQRRFRV
jgi:CRP-like cAMP-binding protein